MEGCRDTQTMDKTASRGMNREEKEVVFATIIAAAVLATICILTFETCIVATVFAVVASLWAYAWGLFGKHLQRQSTEPIDT